MHAFFQYLSYKIDVTMLHINDLHVRISGQEILKGINLDIDPGEIHVIMGPNGSGKSTLAAVLAGRPDCQVTSGTVSFMGEELLQMKPELRAAKGIFLAFQHPVAIPGVSTISLLKTALNEIRIARGQSALHAAAFLKLLKNKLKLLNMNKDFVQRAVNDGFSGGEKKRNEILQMSVLDPRLAILDEIDSGLDVDALRTIGQGIQQIKHKDSALLIITHYPRLLQYIKPDWVHVLNKGCIVQSGDYNLALLLEKEGYDKLGAVGKDA